MPSLCFQLHVTNDETLEDNFQFGQWALLVRIKADGLNGLNRPKKYQEVNLNPNNVNWIVFGK